MHAIIYALLGKGHIFLPLSARIMSFMDHVTVTTAVNSRQANIQEF